MVREEEESKPFELMLFVKESWQDVIPLPLVDQAFLSLASWCCYLAYLDRFYGD